ncbi:MAG: hypothetical protein ABTQ30_04795, partial [Rhizobiaceae bacterium]
MADARRATSATRRTHLAAQKMWTFTLGSLARTGTKLSQDGLRLGWDAEDRSIIAMIRHPRILAGPRIVAGTALSLLMASAPLGAYPLTGSTTAAPHGGLPLVKVQEDCPEGQECGPRQRQGRERQRQQEEGAAPERQERRQRQERQQEQQAEPGDNAPRPERPQRRQREEAQPEAQRPEPEAQRPEPQERPQRRQQRESAPEE